MSDTRSNPSKQPSMFRLKQSSEPVPQFESGRVVVHKKHGYRGVVVRADESFQGSEEWYGEATSKPAKDQPWYHLLVDGSVKETYVAEKNLVPDESAKPVEHPLVAVFWDEFHGGHYTRNRLMN